VIGDRSLRARTRVRDALWRQARPLRDWADLDTVSDNLVAVVMETMQPEHVPLWLKPQTAQNGKQAE
jgi:hypothetical protein